ncbi:MAG: C45 family autoproteolytic acyltransferase/hydrolase [Phenylobacterium sp.]
MRDDPQFRPIPLSGAPYARGEAMGVALRDRIRAHLGAWLGALGGAGVGDPEAYVADMLAETDFTSAIERHTPDLMREVEGIAAGAQAPLGLLFGLQLLDEEWAHRVRLQRRPAKLEKCSSIGLAPATGPTWIAQNMDLGTYTDGHQVLLSISGDDGALAALVFSVAGMIGLMGVNAAGVGVCVNSLPQLPSAPQGLPVAFVLRRLLQARDLTEASELVLSLPHATNQHYLIAGPDGVRSFEASATGVSEFHPPQPSRVLHTNHPLAEVQGDPETAAARENTVARLAALTARLGAGEPGLAEIESALASFDDPRHPVCRLPGAAPMAPFTTGSMIAALQPDRVRSWVSPGPPSVAGYRTFDLASGDAG